MRTLLLALALVCAGCTEQEVEKQDTEKHWSEMIRDSIDYYYNNSNANGAYGDADSVYPGAVWYPDLKCQTSINFATWCQKAHPKVWREYHTTITGGE